MRRPAVLFVVLALAVASCSKGSGDDAAPATTASTSTSTVSTSTTTTTAAPAPTTPGCPPIPAEAQPDPNRPHYVLRVDPHLESNTVDGTVDVRFTPDVATDRLVFRLWPNGPNTARAGARLDTGTVLVSGHAVDATRPDPTTLVVPIAGGLHAGQRVDATVPWTLTLPRPVQERVSRTGDSVRLGSFFPILAWEPGVGWATEPPTDAHGETSTTPTADFAVSVGPLPAGLSVLAGGEPDGPGRWRATAVRDFAMSIGRFDAAEATAHAPNPVHVTVGVAAGIGESPETYLAKAVRALELYGKAFGPYPWPSYTLAITPNLVGGIEYPSHVMQGPGSIGRTTSHEIGHQWFYALVGDDQARDPWLDEGLASWAEARYEGTLASFRSRAVPADARGRLALPMTYWDGHASSYYRGVYVQAVQALGALGDPALVDCALRLYVARNAYRIARPSDLVGALSAVFPGAAATLRQWGINP